MNTTVNYRRVVKLGFSGTHIGMSVAQHDELASMVMRLYLLREFHHGDCIGADEQAHNIIRNVRPDVRITIHPPKNRRRRAWCRGDVLLEEAEYLVRNRRIVDCTQFLVIAPRTAKEELRSGTWATWRYAKPDARYKMLPGPKD